MKLEADKRTLRSIFTLAPVEPEVGHPAILEADAKLSAPGFPTQRQQERCVLPRLPDEILPRGDGDSFSPVYADNQPLLCPQPLTRNRESEAVL